MPDQDELARKFEEADLNDLIDKKTTAVGLGLKTSLLDTKAIQGGGPAFKKISGKIWYKKIDAIEWAIQNKSERKFDILRRPKGRGFIRSPTS